MLKSLASSLLLLALPLAAQEGPELPPSQKMLVNTNIPDDGKWHFSVGVGQHPQGPFLAAVATSPSRWGGFIGHASESTSDSKKPPIGQPGSSEFGVVSLDRQSATHAGVAFRLTRHSVFGLGYGTKTVENYYSGIIPATMQVVRRPDTTTTKSSGGVLMLDFGFKFGFGVHIAYGYGSFGVAAAFRW